MRGQIFAQRNREFEDPRSASSSELASSKIRTQRTREFENPRSATSSEIAKSKILVRRTSSEVAS